MLWDLIRDFFVQHVFGGIASNGDEYVTMLSEDLEGNGLYFNVGITHPFDEQIGTAYISCANWLSSTATMISITIIVVLCCMFVYKIVKLIGGLIR